MIYFCPAKINLGLLITAKRPDGFHELQSLMVPTGLNDILEIRENDPGSPPLLFSQSGIEPGAAPGTNLVEKAHALLSEKLELPPVEIHLHKQVPVGAGLGGGSSDATWTLRGLNDLAGNILGAEELHEMAATLGSDCPFFLHDGPMMMEGRGEILSPSQVDLSAFYLKLLFPRIHISTAEAYRGVKPKTAEIHLGELLKKDADSWKDFIINDFEEGLFKAHPLLEEIKTGLYESGAIYAAMSGSGSAMFGLFRDPVKLPDELRQFLIWEGPAG